MRLISWILLLQISVSFIGNSQTNVSLDLKIGKTKLKLNQVYSLNDSTQVQLTTLRFYMMNVVLYSNGVEYNMITSAKLVNAELDNMLTFNGEFGNIDSLSFLLGTDYKTNTSGVLEGDLDPINGMYWAWNSGYINIKMEGTLQNKGKDKSFEYHLGGYAEPNATAQSVVLVPNSKSLKSIVIDFSTFLFLVDGLKHSILIPGKDAVEIMGILSQSFNE